MDVPADAPLRRPTAPARRAVCWAQIGLGALVLLAAVAVGGAVQDRADDREAARWDADWARVEPVWSGRVR